MGFDKIKEMYERCSDFYKIYKQVLSGPSPINEYFNIIDGYLFKNQSLCLPNTSIRDFVIWEVHQGGLARHFGRNKTIQDLEERFYWTKLKKQVAKVLAQCKTYIMGNQVKQNIELYTPLPTLKKP